MKSWIEHLRKSRIWVFLLVGSANTLIGYVIFGVAYKAVGLNYNVALLIAYILGILIGYANHRRVTFKSTNSHRQAFTRFVMTYLLIYGINAGLLVGFSEWVGLDPLIGQAIALIFVTLISFVVQRTWVFKS
jgi:putative flippase GtrA